MSSRRVYITLNDQKEKDRIIEAYLSQSYSEADAIKEAIYRLATNNISTMNIDAINTDKMKIMPKDNKRVQKGTKKNSNKKVKKGAESKNEDKKVANDTNLIQSASISENKVQIDSDDDIKLDLGQFSDKPVEFKIDNKDKAEKLKQKKLKALKQFM